MDRGRETPESGDYTFKEPPPPRVLREAAPAWREEPKLRVVDAASEADTNPARKEGRKMKTSVYLEPGDVARLAWLAKVENRPQAEVIRDAIRAYEPIRRERTFHIFDTGEGDGRSIIDIPDEELMRGFGADAWGDEADTVGDHNR